jgi:sodium transport system permease protein
MIKTIFFKELKDTLRDRRTLMTMIVIPILVFPLILTIFMKVSESFNNKAADKKLYIGLVENEGTYFKDELKKLPDVFGKTELIIYKDSSSLRKDVKSDSLQFGLFVPTSFNADAFNLEKSDFKLFFNATEIGIKDRAESIVNYLGEQEKNRRLRILNVKVEDVTPFEFAFENVASDKETLGKLIGGFLPYLFIVFGFIGCMYPAIDLFTGEKERGTLETLLTTPTSRWQILIGKMAVVVLSGLMAATFTLLGIFISIEFLNLVKDPKILEVIHQILTPTFIGLLYFLLIPLIVFFAGIMVPIAVYAKSFKEAQSIITPLNFIVIMPAMLGFLPGIELNVTTACIPIINVVLATKELIAGTLEFSMLVLTFSVMLGIASVAVWISYLRFDNESNLV